MTMGQRNTTKICENLVNEKVQQSSFMPQSVNVNKMAKRKPTAVAAAAE